MHTDTNSRQSERHFGDFLDQIPDLILRVSKEGRLEYLNRSAESFFALTPNAGIGLSLFDFIDPNDREDTKNAIVAWLSSDDPVLAFENRMVDCNGDVRWMQWNSVLAKTDSGAISGFHSIVRDITQIRREEELRRDSEERYRLIFEMSEVAIFLITHEGGRMVAASPAAVSMFGYSEKEFCDKGLTGIMDGSDARLWRLMAESRDNSRARGEVGGIRCNGECFPVEMKIVKVEDSKENLLAIVQLRDITEQKRAEKAALESEIRWQFAVESNGGAMWDWDASEDEIFLTDTAEELFDLPKTGVKRTISDLIAQLLVADQPSMQAHIEALVTGAGSEWYGDYRLVTRRGGGRWISIRGRVMLRGPNGEPQRIICIGHDITRQKLKAEEGRRLQDTLAHQERLVMLSELTSGLAHEINQPLMAISGFAAACAKKVSAIPEALTLLQIIEEQALRAGEIGWRMLDFARVERTSYGAVSLGEVIAAVAKLIRLDRSYRTLEIDVGSLDASLPLVRADRVGLEQVLLNLLRNGAEAVRSDGKVPRIAIAADNRQHPGEIKVSVIDWGCGLPHDPDFDPFKRFATTKTYGLGLGLPICQSIIEAHGGQLWATANPEGGSIFQFTLPTMDQQSQID